MQMNRQLLRDSIVKRVRAEIITTETGTNKLRIDTKRHRIEKNNNDDSDVAIQKYVTNRL